MIFTMSVCYLKVGTKPKKFVKNSLFYRLYACIIYDAFGISGISHSSRTYNDKAYTSPQLFGQFFNFRIFIQFFIMK